MTEYDDSGDTAARGTMHFMDGRAARTTEDRMKAGAEKQRYKEAHAKKVHQENMNAQHPKGLAEIREHDGSVSRQSGSKDW